MKSQRTILIFVIRSVTLLSLVLFQFGSVAPPAQAQEPAPYGNMSANLDNLIVNGNGWPAGHTVTLTVHDPNGSFTDFDMQDVSDMHPDWNPFDPVALFYLRDRVSQLAGLELTMSDGFSTQQLTVADLRITAVDRATNTVSGRAPGGLQVNVQLQLMDESTVMQQVTADGSGQWLADFSGLAQMFGGMNVWADLTRPGEVNNTHFGWRVPVLNVNADDYVVRAHHWPVDTVLTMEVSGSITQTAQAVARPWFPDSLDSTTAEFNLDPSHHLLPGDTITVSGGGMSASMTITGLAVTAFNYDADTISGIASPGAYVNIWIAPGTYDCQVNRTVQADAEGNWTVYFGAGSPAGETCTPGLKPGDFGQAQENNAGTLQHRLGDETWITWATPAFSASPGNNWIEAWGWPMRIPVSITIQRPGSPDFTDTQITHSGSAAGPSGVLGCFGYVSSYDFKVGDTITLSAGNVTKSLVVSPLMITSISTETDQIQGITSPDRRVSVWAAAGDGSSAGADMRSLGDGTWTADFAGSVDLTSDSWGTVMVMDEDQDSTRLDWPAPEECAPGNTITGTVYEHDGITPVPSAVVDFDAYSASDRVLFWTTADQDGHYSCQLPVGHYQVRAHTADWSYNVEWYRETNPQNATELDTTGGAHFSGIDFTISLKPPVEHLIFNTNNPLLTLGVRQAIAYGIDRQRILTQAWNPNGIYGAVINTMVPPELPWAAASDSELQLYPYNPQLARTTLADAGWTDIDNDGRVENAAGEHLVLTFQASNTPQRISTAAIFVENMANIGIQIDASNADTVDFAGHDLSETGWGACDDTAVCLPGYMSGMNAYGFPGYSNQAYDAAINSALHATDDATRRPFLVAAQQMLAEDLPVLPYFTRYALPQRPRFMLNVNNDSSWRGADAWNWPPGSRVTLTVDDPVYSETQTMQMGTNGYTHAMYMQDGVFQGHPGSTITVSFGSLTKMMKVPLLTITGFDLLNDTVSGKTDAFTTIVVPVSLPDGSDYAEQTVTGDAEGNWTVDFSGLHDLAPGDTVEPQYYDADGDHVVLRDWTVPGHHVPQITSLAGPISPIALGNVASLTALFSDAGGPGNYAATWDWGDGTTTSTSPSLPSDTTSHAYASPGVYTVKLTITDGLNDSGTAAFEYVVVYDASGGFVTGGGWINSPAGAYLADPTLTGRATFGFESKYKRGATIPSGNTEFRFQVADLGFKSTSYEWLVVAGSKAQFKGIGTINGSGSYGFLLSAIDGTLDKFRIKIWDKASGTLIYDNQLGASEAADPTTVLAGGAIVIHK